MINDIGIILKSYISTLPFTDKIAGVVKPITYKETDQSGRVITKTIPVDCNVTHADCVNKKYTDLIPNSQYKSVMYFEDQGTTRLSDTPKDFTFQSTLKLVCWLNLKKMGKTNCSNSALAVASVLNVLPTRYFNNGVYTRMLIEVTGQDIKSPQIFSRYTYDEEKTQFLMYPYDYFSLTVQVKFTISKACITEWQNEPEVCAND